MYHPNHKKPQPFLSSPRWSGISGLLTIIGTIIALLTFLGITISVVPQASPIRKGIQQTFSGTQVPTDTPVPTPALAPAETLTENVVLTCNDCSDPVVPTIKTIKIEPNNNRMIWTVQMHNVSQSPQDCSFYSFTLKNAADDHSFDPTGNLTASSACDTTGQSSQIQAGETVLITGTFTFVPLTHTQYTLLAESYDGEYIHFLPVQFTF